MKSIKQSGLSPVNQRRSFLPLPEEIPADFRCVHVQIPDGLEYIELLRTVLKSLTLWYNYARDETHRGKLIADLWRDAFLLPELGCGDMNCEELTECLTPFFDALALQLGDMQLNVNALIEQAVSNRAKLPNPITTEGDENIYAGALALVRSMNADIEKIFNDSEMSAADNASEAVAVLLEAIPFFGALPFDEMFELANAYFENQQFAYESDYPGFEEPAACDLYCRIRGNGDTFDFNVWANWLEYLATLLEGSAAAAIYSKHSPIRQMFLNQIAEFLNSEMSSQAYFDQLSQVYFAGTQGTEAVPLNCCINEICGIVLSFVAQPPGLVVTSGELDPNGFLLSAPFDAGGGATAWTIAGWTGVTVTGLEIIKMVFSDGLEKAWQIYTDTGLFSGVDTPVYVGGGEFIVEYTLGTAYTGTITQLNMRQTPIPNTTPFRLIRIELCEE